MTSNVNNKIYLKAFINYYFWVIDKVKEVYTLTKSNVAIATKTKLKRIHFFNKYLVDKQ